MPDNSLYREHRTRFLERLEEEGAAAVLPTATPKVRNHDNEFPFRPESDFWYLTGFDEPGAVLVLLPRGQGRERSQSVLFLREKKADEEVWTGRRLGVEAAPEALGVDSALPIERLWSELPDLLEGYERIVWRTGRDEAGDRAMLGVLETLRHRPRNLPPRPAALLDPAPLLHEQRLFKRPGELERMRRAAAISAEAHLEVMAAARPGMREYELDALLSYCFRSRGAGGEAYPNIVAAGDNACILHYRASDAELLDGQLVLVDAGCEVDCYASDITRTFPAGGRFSAEQRALYDVVLQAQLEALSATRPGATVVGVHEVALGVLVRGLLELGLLEGSQEQVLESKSYRRFYMHRTSHWLGLDVHDCGAYTHAGRSRSLEPGMVLTIEPGLYVAPDDGTVEPRWRGIGVRIEDDALVTPDGHEILTGGVPKAAEEVEQACTRRPLLAVP
jgi:Xaa-Pro aminopeptidase